MKGRFLDSVLMCNWSCSKSHRRPRDKWPFDKFSLHGSPGDSVMVFGRGLTEGSARRITSEFD